MPAAPGPVGMAGRLTEELDLLQSFVALLRREHALLAEARVDALGPLAAEKSDLAGRLGQCANQRERELATLGLPAGRAGMEAWLATPAGLAGRNAWERLLALTAEARALNETSGKLIALHLQHNQQALAALLAAAGQAMTYGPDGQQRGGGGGRSLGSA